MSNLNNNTYLFDLISSEYQQEMHNNEQYYGGNINTN